MEHLIKDVADGRGDPSMSPVWLTELAVWSVAQLPVPTVVRSACLAEGRSLVAASYDSVISKPKALSICIAWYVTISGMTFPFRRSISTTRCLAGEG